MNIRYVLDENGEPRPEPDVLQWACWFENIENRVVQRDIIGGLVVSTVFLGLDHNFSQSGPPILWETMVFFPGMPQNPYRDFQRRYTSKEAALEDHRKIMQMLTDQLIPSEEKP